MQDMSGCIKTAAFRANSLGIVLFSGVQVPHPAPIFMGVLSIGVDTLR